MISSRSICLLLMLCIFADLALAKSRKRRLTPKWRTKVEGQFSPQVRLYERDSNSVTQDEYSDFTTQFELKAKKAKQRAKLNLIARAVNRDAASSQFYAKEAWWSTKKGDSEYLLGINYFRWSQLEMFHPIDLINPIEIFAMDQVGELMAMYRKSWFNSSLALLLLPHRSINILNNSARSRIGLPNIGGPIFVNGNQSQTAQRWATNFAIEFKQSRDSYDYRLLYYQGLDRSLELFQQDGSLFRPLYFQTQSLAFNMQAAWGPGIGKLEVVHKNFADQFGFVELKPHQVIAAGYELNSVRSNSHEIAYLLEYQGVLGVSDSLRDFYYTFQNDLFIGIRYALGDARSTEYFLAMIADLSRANEQGVFAKYSRRLSPRSSIEIAAQAILARQKQVVPLGLERQDGDNFLSAKWVYYFR